MNKHVKEQRKIKQLLATEQGNYYIKLLNKIQIDTYIDFTDNLIALTKTL